MLHLLKEDRIDKDWLTMQRANKQPAYAKAAI